ncbi:NaeI family type II restriction endonuclease [Burkholderia sp. LMG 32019]|uniref:NaeI family type II restriction endonuclease n=1 Tax=Burkholderia sp. LMG 32019 TaxID=3158173 RepID=UPI003C2E57F0
MDSPDEIQQTLFAEPAVIELPVAAPPPPQDSEIAERMEKIKWDLVRRVGDEKQFAARVGQLIREAVDYVIDAPTLFRYSVDELDPDEKTAIGKRIERLLRFQFKLPKGKKLDIQLGGEEVDIKTTMRNNWMFSKSSHGHVNLLIAYDEFAATYRLGLAYVLEHQLGAHNRDQKQSLAAEHRENIYWILKDEPYPSNFLAQLPESVLSQIISLKTGMKRVVQLLRIAHGKPIPRHVICSVANQKDPLRRTRSNGGARDILWKEGILVLSGTYECDRAVATNVASITLADDETMTLFRTDPRLNQQTLASYQTAHNLS